MTSWPKHQWPSFHLHFRRTSHPLSYGSTKKIEDHDEIVQLLFPSNGNDKIIQDIINYTNNKKQPTLIDIVDTQPQTKNIAQVGTDGQSPPPSIIDTLGSAENPNPNDNSNKEAPSHWDKRIHQRITPGTATQSTQLDGQPLLPPYQSVKETSRPNGPPPALAIYGIHGTAFTSKATLVNRFSYSTLWDGEATSVGLPSHNFTSQEWSKMDLELTWAWMEKAKEGGKGCE